MRIIKLPCTVIIVIFSFLSAYSKNDSTISLKGHFSDINMEGRTILLYHCPDYFGATEPTLRGIKHTTTVKDGKFEFQIDQNAKYAYLMLSYATLKDLRQPYRDDNKNHTYDLHRKVFLVAFGSQIIVNVSKGNEATFAGKGAELLECQYKINKVQLDRANSKQVERSYYDTKLAQKEHFTQLHQRELRILDSYEPKIGQLAYEVLKADYFYNWQFSLIRLRIDSENLQNKELNKESLKFYIDFFLFKDFKNKMSDSAIHYSCAYPKFLLEKARRDLDMLMRVTSVWVRPTFTQVYDKINQTYTGLLKEKILALYFINYFDVSEVPQLYLDVALKDMKIPEYRQIIQKIKETKGEGQYSLDFSLTDSTGNKVTIDMLKGKLLVLDFWFTGCGGCAYLTKKMKPIFDHYKDNQNILFVSIATDKDMATWKQSIRSGIYTHEGGLDLFTDGLGREHPIIKHFDIYAYPTLILINQEGKIITSSPPRPVTEEAGDRFIYLVDSYLE